MVDRRKQAQQLVNAWGRDDAELVKVYGFHIVAPKEDEPAEFLIVSGSAMPTGSVEPFGFGPSKSVPFPTRIAEVPADEFEAKKTQQGYLPKNWRIDEAVELSPER